MRFWRILARLSDEHYKKSAEEEKERYDHSPYFKALIRYTNIKRDKR